MIDLFGYSKLKNSDENDAEDSSLSASDYKEKRCNCQQTKEKKALSSNLLPLTLMSS
jgi:hypothetical protein